MQENKRGVYQSRAFHHFFNCSHSTTCIYVHNRIDAMMCKKKRWKVSSQHQQQHIAITRLNHGTVT